MSNQVISRKYRPKLFSEIVGQEHIVQTLKNAIAANMAGHAYLFAGPRGTGKTTIARLLAKSLNCLNRKAGEFEPCNICDSCLEISQGNAIDLVEIDAASNRGIDEIRDLKDGIRFLPVKSRYKVFIIDESHQLTKEASNALLKTLEEPPGHAIFILATTEVQKMLPTIISRCQSFYFRMLQLPEIVSRLSDVLQQEKITYDKSALDLIALAAGGALRDAETLLNSAVSFVGQDGKIEKKEIQMLLGVADNAVIFQFLNFLQEKQVKEAVEFLNDIIYKGVDLKEFAKSVIQFLREMLFFQIDADLRSPLLATLTSDEKKKLHDLSVALSAADLKQMLSQFTEAENKMKYATILQLPLELAVVEICMEKSL